MSFFPLPPIPVPAPLPMPIPMPNLPGMDQVASSLGNIVEGIVEGVTGEQIELTPGKGVDNTKAKGPRGSGEIQFDKKLATHDDVEQLRREVQKKLRAHSSEIARLKAERKADKTLGAFPRPQVPTFQPPMHPGMPMPSPQNQSGGLNSLLMLMLAQEGKVAQNPMLLMLLLQSMQSMSIGQVGGQNLNLDLSQVMLLSTLLGTLGGNRSESRSVIDASDS